MQDRILTFDTAEGQSCDVRNFVTSGLLVDGQWKDAASGRRFEVVDPATCEAFTDVAEAGVEDVDAAVAAARAAAPGWAGTSPTDRGTLLSRWADLVLQYVEDLAPVEARDVGKPLSGARTNIYIAHSIISYNAGLADKITGATLPSRTTDRFGLTVREPLGVCAVVLPWNVPALLMAANVAPALAAGNTVVLKPSENAPLSPLALAALAQEAGLPDGVLNVVVGGPQAGAALSSHRDIDHISFVGSTATGRLILAAAAQSLIPAKVELGGKSPNVVFADADLDEAIPTIAWSFTDNSGQNCYAGSRLLVEDSIADEVTERLVAELATKRLGPWDEDLDLGPLVNGSQASRVRSYIDSASGSGARLLTARSDAEGWYVPPALFDQVGDDAPIVREEVFGPVATIQRFSGVEDAVRRVNDTPYGLLTSVWTNDISRALRVMEDVHSGQVSINEFSNSAIIGFPFNMAKESGFSHGGGYNALNEYTREKAVTIRLLDR